MAGVAVNPLALVMGRQHLILAGLPNAYPEDDIFKAVEGQMGGVMLVVSRKNGSPVATYDLQEIPAWDGMAAANGKLLLSCKDGRVICFAEKSRN